MHMAQKPYLDKVLSLLSVLAHGDRVGTVHVRQDNHSAVLNVHTLPGLWMMLTLICDKLRTPKAYQLDAVATYLNGRGPWHFAPVTPAGWSLDRDSGWFAGFCEALGSFGLDLRSAPRIRVACQSQLNQRAHDPKSGRS